MNAYFTPNQIKKFIVLLSSVLFIGTGQTLMAQEGPTVYCQDVVLPLDAYGVAVLSPAMVDGGSSATAGISHLSLSRSTFSAADIKTTEAAIGNYALHFSNNNDAVTLNEEFTYQPHEAFSAEAWIKTEDANGEIIMIDTHPVGHSKANSGWKFTMRGGRPGFVMVRDWDVDDYLYVAARTVINDGQWHHVAFTYNGSGSHQGVAMYVDGQPALSYKVGGKDVLSGSIISYDPAVPGMLGGNNRAPFSTNNNMQLDGLLDEVRIWNGARSAAAIAASWNRPLSTNEAGLAGYWPMEDGPGSGVVTDKTGAAQGTLYNINHVTDWVGDLASIPVTLTVTDNNGQSANCTAQVFVVDRTAPIARVSPLSLSLAPNEVETVGVEDFNTRIEDNSGSETTVSLDKTSFSLEDIGENNVTLTITDSYGNASETHTTVTVTSTIKHVNASAASGGTGESWASAFTSLHYALEHATDGDTVAVAGGTYNPEVTDGFVLHSGVVLLGGFAGNEASFGSDVLANRNLEGNTTVLNAQMDLQFAHHVVFVDTAASAATVLDGFTLTNGHGEYGGGIYNFGGAPKLNNLVVHRNTASKHGGGLYNKYSSAPELQNVKFLDNTADWGGAIYSYRSRLVANNVLVMGNTAADWCGGIYNDQTTANLSQVTFKANTAQFCAALYNKNNVAEINRVIIWDNASEVGPTIYKLASGKGESRAEYANSIIKGSSHWAPEMGTNMGGNVDVAPEFAADGYTVIEGTAAFSIHTNDHVGYRSATNREEPASASSRYSEAPGQNAATEALTETLKVYPNPTKGMATVEAEGHFTVWVYNLKGSQVARTQGFGLVTLNLNSEQAGHYLVRIQQENGTIKTTRLVLH